MIYIGEPDRRGTLVTHGFHTPDELSRLKAQSPAPVESRLAPPRGTPTGGIDVVEEITKLKAAVIALETQMSDLRKQLGLS